MKHFIAFIVFLLAALSVQAQLKSKPKLKPEVQPPDVSIEKLHTPLLEKRGCYFDAEYNISVRVLRVVKERGLYLAQVTNLKTLKTKRLVFNMASLNALALKNFKKVDCGTGEVTDEKLSY